MAADWETAGEIAEGASWRARGERARTGVRPRPQAAAARPLARGAVARFFGWFVAIGLFISVALVVPITKSAELAAPGGVLIALGRVAGLAGTFLMLVTLLLIGRIPAIEGALGQDTLVRWHRRLGPWVLGLLSVHVVALVLGYAQQVSSGPLHELGTMVLTFPGMLMAAVGSGLFLLAGLTSYKYARRKMRYETWWAVHLYTYLAAALSLPHQLWTGAPFLALPPARAWWIALWVFTAGAVLWYRWGLPIVRSLRHRLVVEAVQKEGPGVVSVVVRGRHLEALPVAGGQFLQWRFLKRGLWWQAHPYSLSALPAANRMRITVKQLGDHSETLSRVTPGTRVAIEGPYGAFTHHARHNDRIVLVAAGVGATPVRAMLDDLPWHVDVVAILRGSSRRDLVLRDEIAHLVGERGGRLHEVVGPRTRAPLDGPALARLVPDIAERDLFVCGPHAFMDALARDARALGVHDEHIHYEDFAF